jgi:hypothetical protein
LIGANSVQSPRRHSTASSTAPVSRAIARCTSTLTALATLSEGYLSVDRHACDWTAVRQLSAGIERLQQGFDPTELGAGRKFHRADDIRAFVTGVLTIAPKADAFYVYHGFVTTALALGCNPIEQLKSNGAIVDVWTLDPSTQDVEQILPSLHPSRR